MRQPIDFGLFWLVLSFALLLGAAVTAVVGVPGPLIREVSVERIFEVTGEPALVYRYAVDGLEAFVVLRDEAELESYRAYLRRVGRFCE